MVSRKDCTMKKRNWIGSFFFPVAISVETTLILLTDRVLGWMERSRQRAVLGRLDPRLLSDIGCDRARAAAEADKPFWRK